MATKKDPTGKAPSTYDRLIKLTLRHASADLAAWLVGERPVEVSEIETAIPVAAMRFADKILSLSFPNRPPILLHVEFQVEGGKEMPQRMAEYVVLLWGARERGGHGARDIASVVIYLDRESYREDPGVFEYDGPLGLRLSVRYRVVKLWELDPSPFLAMDRPGLCPFVPLMAGKPVELLLQSQEKITGSPDKAVSPEAKQDLLMALGVLAGRVIKDHELICRLLSEVRLMGENTFLDLLREEGRALGLEEGRKEGFEEGREEGRQEGREEGRQEGRQEGRREGARTEVCRGIVRVLRRRFSGVSPKVVTRLEEVQDMETLEAILEEAAVCPTLEAFVGFVERVERER